jgi:hypothetical protein
MTKITNAELSLDELLAEGGSELPERALMRHRRRHGGASASAFGGSVANSNSTDQSISNPQIAIGNGGPVTQVGNNTNSNTTSQSGTVLNF